MRDDDDRKGGSVGVAGGLAAPKGGDRGRACLTHPKGNEQMVMVMAMAMTMAMMTMITTKMIMIMD